MRFPLAFQTGALRMHISLTLSDPAGMCLLDTTDGALMMTLYTATALGRDQLAILYYSSVLTAVTILAALIIGFIQLLSLVQNVAQPEGRFWDGVQVAGDHYDIIGRLAAVEIERKSHRLIFGKAAASARRLSSLED